MTFKDYRIISNDKDGVVVVATCVENGREAYATLRGDNARGGDEQLFGRAAERLARLNAA